MNFVVLLALVAFVGLCAYAIARAFVAGDSAGSRLHVDDADALRRLGALAEEKAQLIEEIRATELERETEKISDEECARTVRELERKAAVVMRAMDALQGSEEDRDRARRELARIEAEADRESDAAHWSPAARLRHGGRFAPRGES